MSTEALHLLVARAMQLAWIDFIGDTGCIPDCFTLSSARANTKVTADFSAGNFARLVADHLAAALDTGPPANPDAAEGLRLLDSFTGADPTEDAVGALLDWCQSSLRPILERAAS